MATLAFQTAFGPAEIAILTGDGAAFAVADTAAGPGQDARLPGLMDTVLGEACLTLAEVTRVGVVAGPGSFTGLRMGLAFARGLGLVLECPVIGVSLLEACLPPGCKGPIRVALQAQRRPPDLTFWTQDFGDGTALAPPEEWPIERVASGDLLLMTDRPELFSGRANVTRAAPSAITVAHWAEIREPADAPPSPIYVRPPDAALPGGRKR